MAETKSTSNDSNLYGALAYVFGLVTGVIMLLIKPEDKYVKFHALQSIIVTIVAWIVFMIIGFVMTMLTLTMAYSGMYMFATIFSMVYLGLSGLCFLGWLFLMWKAYSGEKFKLPIIGDQAEKMAK